MGLSVSLKAHLAIKLRSPKGTSIAWFNSTVLIANDTICSNAIYLNHQSTGCRPCRNVYFLASGLQQGFRLLGLVFSPRFLTSLCPLDRYLIILQSPDGLSSCQ